MENFLKLVFAFVIGFILVVIAMPKVIPFLHKMKFGQVEREEGLESHKVKNGTPTMGGIVFVLAAIIAAVIVNIGDLFNPEIILATIVLVGYSLIGFVDDGGVIAMAVATLACCSDAEVVAAANAKVKEWFD